MTVADAPDLVKAKLVPFDGANANIDDAVTVQFNPSSLKVTLENEIKADTGSKGKKSSASQHIEKRSSSLAIELVFDTSLPETEGAVEDVRKKTAEIADKFMKPGTDEKTPKRLRFQWGTFQFDGIIASYAETLDYFSPEGVPLRATVALSIKEDAYQFAFATPPNAPQPRKPPTIVGAPEQPVHETVQRARKDPRDWRDTALANGVENPRLPGGGGFGIGVSVGIGVSAGAGLSVEVGASAGGSFAVGASASLGTSIPGAFVDLPQRPSASADVSIGIGIG